MADLVVGISDLKVSNNPADSMITFSLGSCIAVAVYDPVAKVGGLLHFMLPDSTLDAGKAKDTPAMFADTGIPLLFNSCYSLGADKTRMVVKVAGGASILDESNFFRIGQKNIMAMQKLFGHDNVLIDAEDTGENINRTVRIDLGTGKVFIKRARGQMEEL